MDKKPVVHYSLWCILFGFVLILLFGLAYSVLNVRLEAAKQLLQDQQVASITGQTEKIKALEGLVKEEVMLIENRQSMALSLCVVGILLGLGGGWWLGRRIDRGSDGFFDEVIRVAADPEWTKRIQDAPGIYGELAVLMNGVLNKGQAIHKEVGSFSARLGLSVDSVLQKSKEASLGLDRQLAETEKVATTINQMSETVQEVARNTNSAADAAKEAREEASSGQAVVTETMNAIQLLADEVQTASDVIQRLSTDSNNIGSVLDVIRGISDQTNLLALNAAIEAARAGEAGRGFAVVADEVRTLAKRTGESTEEIQKMIERLQTGASEAVKVMEQGRSRAHNSVAQASKAGNSLNSITASVQKISELNTQIASAADEQSKVAEDIHQKVLTIGTLCKTSSSGVHESLLACQSLHDLVGGLNQISAKTTLSGGFTSPLV